MVAGTINASGGVMAGAIDGVGGTSTGIGTDEIPGVQENILQHQGTPHNSLAQNFGAGSQLCEDIVNSELYMGSGTPVGGSYWIRLISGT